MVLFGWDETLLQGFDLCLTVTYLTMAGRGEI